MPATVADDVGWIIRERVPVYDAHELEFRDRKSGDVIRSERVDAARLQKIADARNAKIERSGDESPIIVGHTKPDAPEWEQPPIVGYADHFQVAPHEKDGRPTMYCRYKLYPSSIIGDTELPVEEILKRFPRRSPEVWLDHTEDGDDDLDAIALLGPTTPARYLGLVRMTATADQRISEVNTMDDLQNFLAALQELIAKFSGAPAGEPVAEEPPAGDAAAVAEGDEPARYSSLPKDQNAAMWAQVDEAGGYKGGKRGKGKDGKMGGYVDMDGEWSSYSASTLGPTNATTAELDKVKYARQQQESARVIRDLQSKVQSMQAEHKQLQVHYAATARQALRANRRQELMADLNDGIILDVDEELDFVAPEDHSKEALSEDEWIHHHGRIQKRYQKNGAGHGFVRTADLDQVGTAGKPAAHDKIMSIVRAKPGTTYHEAEALASQRSA